MLQNLLQQFFTNWNLHATDKLHIDFRHIR